MTLRGNEPSGGGAEGRRRPRVLAGPVPRSQVPTDVGGAPGLARLEIPAREVGAAVLGSRVGPTSGLSHAPEGPCVSSPSWAASGRVLSVPPRPAPAGPAACTTLAIGPRLPGLCPPP